MLTTVKVIPREITAIKWLGTNIDDLADLLADEVITELKIGDSSLTIGTEDSPSQKVQVGRWLALDDEGELFTLSDRSLERNYEAR